MRKNEPEGPDLTKIGCAEAVAKRLRQEEFQDLEKIGIKNPPDADENDDVQEWNRGKNL